MREPRMTAQQATTIRAAVKDKYRAFAERAAGMFPYPVGRESAEGLGYERGWLDRIPSEVIDRFVGVGNLFGLERPREGDRVLDVGCGCGLDSFVSSILVGDRGSVVGVDLTPEMLVTPRRELESWPFRNLQFAEHSAEDLPFEDQSFDLVISNGALNLVPDKDAAFRQFGRVLRPGGRFVAADLLVDEAIPEDLLASQDAWST